MKKHSPFTQPFELLPNTLPIFPLPSAVVLPGGLLPLNIFEPRYLNMIKDAMQGEQLIGMIQPQNNESPPSLFKVGCAARIIRYEETSDGRLEILLAGLCRFEIGKELSSMRGYRLILPKWERFENDYQDSEPCDRQTSFLFSTTLRSYFKQREIDVDWAAIEQLSQETLINNLLSQLPLSVADKQLLLESKTIGNRVESLIAVLKDQPADIHARH